MVVRVVRVINNSKSLVHVISVCKLRMINVTRVTLTTRDIIILQYFLLVKKKNNNK